MTERRKKPEELRSHRWFGLGPFSFATISRASSRLRETKRSPRRTI